MVQQERKPMLEIVFKKTHNEYIKRHRYLETIFTATTGDAFILD